MLEREQAHRHGTAGAEFQLELKACFDQMDFAIAAKADGAHGNRLHHGLKATDAGTEGVEPGRAVPHDGDVGGGAANVGDNRILRAGHIACADKRCGRAGQDRLDRAFAGDIGGDQCAIATHDHDGGLDAALVEEEGGCSD